jgi:acyl-CoA reductase-like NAD-dependent aldehyde dehydrogenase
VVGAVVPWNSPLLLETWKLAPALAAGCTVVVKPSEHTPASALELARLFEEADFPPGVYNVVPGFGTPTGRALVRHPGVDKVAFTGSTETGKQVMKDAADHLAKVSLELGGKSPNIIFDDTDLDAAINGVVAGIFAATGQTCMAGSRLFVARHLEDEVVGRLAERARAIRLGDPLDPATEMGPVAFEKQLDKVKHYIELGQQEGAKLVCGGRSPEDEALRHGFFIEPTIFAQASNEMRVARRRSSAPCSARFPSKTKRRSSGRPTTRPTGWPRPSGRRMCGGRIGWRMPSGRGPCGSTPPAPSPSTLPSAATSRAASGGRTGSRRSTSTPR